MAPWMDFTYCQWLVNHNLKIVSHYFERARFFVYVTLRNLGNECDKRFTSTTVTFWVILIVLLWSVIYLLYRKVVGVSFILCYTFTVFDNFCYTLLSIHNRLLSL
jgi:hypothetical protein